METASDLAIWNLALKIGAAVVTKDEDFARHKAMSGDGPAVIWLRLPNTRRKHLLIWFEKALPNIVSALARGETLIEVL